MNFGIQKLIQKHFHTMKTKLLFAVIILLLAFSCSSPKYLPSSDKIDINEFGSYIKISMKEGGKIDGELIAIDSSQIVILSAKKKKCLVISIDDIKRFTLQYAQSKQYGWTIPVFLLSTISHGFFSIFTVPVNLIVTISTTSSGNSAFKYKSKSMNYEKLRMFARFPQGIPLNIPIDSIQ